MKMKKIFALCSMAILLFGCSKSDNENNSQNNSASSDFHPPSWIIANWKQGSSTNYFNFPSDDIVYQSSTSSVSQKGLFNNAR